MFVSASHIKPQSGVNKLDQLARGPFKIIKKINDVTFALDLPKSWKVHYAFHVSLLKLANKDDDQKFSLRSSKPPPEPEIQEDNTVEYEVEKIVDRRKRYGKMQFPVRWKGYGPEEDTWEPTASLRNAQRILKAYKDSVRQEIQLHNAQMRTEQEGRRKRRMVNRDIVDQSMRCEAQTRRNTRCRNRR